MINALLQSDNPATTFNWPKVSRAGCTGSGGRELGPKACAPFHDRGSDQSKPSQHGI